MNHFEKYSELTAKFLAGQTNPTEEQALFAWTEADPANQRYFDELVGAWAVAGGTVQAPFEADTKAAWAKVEASIDEGATIRPLAGKVVRLSKIVQRWSVAAAILLALGVGLWWLGRQPAQPQLVEIQTTGHEQKAIVLPDSSRVWLNENSRLAYDPSFEQRHVTLEGEAFFEVERMEHRPFEILSGGATTTVLGTSFNVRAYPVEGKVEVTVRTGKVALAVAEHKAKSILLAPGETGVFDKKEEKVEIATIEEDNADAWKTQKLAFDDEKMAQVVTSLERYFNVEIEAADLALLDCPYTSTFVQPDLEAILTVIGNTIGFEFEKTAEGKYLLKGGGCK